MRQNVPVFPDTGSARWHWGEGNKYVIEGGKSLFLLNGAAAAGLLTIIGNGKAAMNSGLRAAIISFACGSMLSAILFSFGYIAQLHYGQAARAEEARDWAVADARPEAEAAAKVRAEKALAKAMWWHNASYASAGLSALLFFVGTIVAALNL